MYLPTDIIRTGESLIINNMEVTFMYCKNCGNEMKAGAAVCLECGMARTVEASIAVIAAVKCRKMQEFA